MKSRFITLWRVIHAGIVNFIRNASLAIAAMAVMVVTLTIVLFSVVTNATFNNTIAQITNKIDVSVFLEDSATESQTDQLVAELRQQPNVKSVEYLDKDAALKDYQRQNVGNEQLLLAINQTSNPIPPTIHVKPGNLNDINGITKFLTKDENKKLQTEGSPSYSGDRKEAIDKITHATNVLRRIGIILVAVFTMVCALIIFNTIQMAIFNRRDEIQIQRLLGASTNFIRGPFIVESIIYGILSGVISILIVNAAFLASSNTLEASSLGLLDINFASTYFGEHFLQLLAMQLMLGIVIGAVSSVIATHRYLKFKTK